MLNDPAPESGTGFRTYVIVSVLAFLFAIFYIGFVFYSRSQANRAIEEKAAEKIRAQDTETFELMGGNRFDILQFYASPPSIHAGETTSLCYGVSNAKSVKLEPQTGPVWPAYDRCVDASPRKTTRYTLTIEDDTGHSKSASIEVIVSGKTSK